MRTNWNLRVKSGKLGCCVFRQNLFLSFSTNCKDFFHSRVENMSKDWLFCTLQHLQCASVVRGNAEGLHLLSALAVDDIKIYVRTIFKKGINQSKVFKGRSPSRHNA